MISTRIRERTACGHPNLPFLLCRDRNSQIHSVLFYSVLFFLLTAEHEMRIKMKMKMK